jgi:thermostable 8-oxoguanine DNA glycosylase
LLYYKVISSIPKNINKNKYLELEQKFIKFSEDIKIPLVDLDLLFWAKQTGVVFK